MKQAEFAELVGVSVQAVSGWVRAGRLQRGDCGLQWLRTSQRWLSEQAAGRGEENPLTEARTRLADEQAQAKAMENAIKRREWAPVALVGDVIGAVARQIRSDLESIVPEVRIRCPEVPLEALHVIEKQVVAALQRASDARIDLAVLAEADKAPDGDENDEDGA